MRVSSVFHGLARTRLRSPYAILALYAGLGAATWVWAETSSPAESAAPAAAKATASTSSASDSRPLEEVNGYLKIGFDRITGYPFNPAPYDPDHPNATPPSAAAQIPDRVKQLDGKKAMVTGFMLPVKTDKGLVTEFLLLRDPMMCCYGVMPQINEWIMVRMPNGVQALQDVPLSFLGTFHVKEIYDGGYLSGIYSLDAEKMVAAK